MADNVTLPGTGIVAASDDIGGVQYQRVKVGHGADGSYTDTSAANPFPVTATQTASTYTANTAGVASAVLVTADAARRFLRVRNNSAVVIGIAQGVAATLAAPSILIAPGGSANTDPDQSAALAWNIIAASAGAAYLLEVR